MEIKRKGSSPKICLVAGTHGDEFGVISSVEKALRAYSTNIPDYIWIPTISPSAVAQKTRTNTSGNDLNRQFHEDPTDAEAIAVMDALRQHHFDLFVSFHEDLEFDQFYCYDSASTPPPGWDQFCKALTRLDIPLLNGADDPKDPTLGYLFTNGYLQTPITNPKIDGTLESWVLVHGVTKRYLNLEIPGRVPMDLKNEIVDAFFRHVLMFSKN